MSSRRAEAVGVRAWLTAWGIATLLGCVVALAIGGRPLSRAGVQSSPPVSRRAPELARPARVAQPLPATPSNGDVEDLRRRDLVVPVAGAERSQVTPGFAQMRGDHRHEAVDILAARGTPVIAVDEGTVVKLFNSKAGGLTVYQFDPSGRYAYYYAHLDRYADGLSEGQRLTRRDVLGYVGTTGNADPALPHLHFAIFKLGPERRWWQGAAIDPYAVFSVATPAGSAASSLTSPANSARR